MGTLFLAAFAVRLLTGGKRPAQVAASQANPVGIRRTR
jgi:hypothetical protein